MLTWAAVWSLLAALTVGALGLDYFADFEESRLANAQGCPDPQPIANAYRWIQSPNTVEYRCVESYNMTEGSGVLTCETDGTWLGQLPACDLYCGRPPQSPGTLWPPQITNHAMVTFTPDLEIGEAFYTCKSQLSDTDLDQDNKVACDRAHGHWKSPANVFCKNDSSLPIEDWLPDNILFMDETTTSNGIFDQANDTSGLDTALLDYLSTDCHEMLNAGSFAKLTIPFLPRGRDFELTWIEMHLQTIHANDECVETLSNGIGVGYIGTTNTTTSNLTCQAWAEQTPHTHQFTTSNLFADASFDDVKNYCRNPKDRGSYKEKPWCYTTDPNVKWDFCDIPACHLFRVEVFMVNASDGGKDLSCGHVDFYTSDISRNWTIDCDQEPTGPFGTELKISANASQPLYLCELGPHGVDSVSGCGEPPHQRGWTMVSFDGHSLGDQANYTCAPGYYYKKGSKVAECARTRTWHGPYLECSDEPNLALDGSTLRDNSNQTCTVMSAGTTTAIQLGNVMEVIEIVLILQDGSAGTTSGSLKVDAIIHDGTDRSCYDIMETDEGYLVTCRFQPFTDLIQIVTSSDLNVCEVAVFGRNSSETLECTTQSSGGVDYKGFLNVSVEGHDCIPWTEHNRISDFIFGDGDSSYVNNYCRNPFDLRDNDWYSGSRPICFFRNQAGDIERDYCDVFACEYGCRNDRSGVAYRGEINYIGIDETTRCERWDEGDHRFTRKVDFAGDTTNHHGCRNPGRSQERAWCITDSSSLPVAYSYCNIPECPKSTEIEWTVSADLNNQTQIDELYSLTSNHFRECICTDKDHRSYIQPDLFTQLAHGFCTTYPGDYKSLMCHHTPTSTESASLGDGATWSSIFILCPYNPETIQPTLITEAPTLAVEFSTGNPTVQSSSDTPSVEGTTEVVNFATGPTTAAIEISTESIQDTDTCPTGCTVACINVTNYETTAREKMQELLEDNQRRMYVDTASLSKQKRKKTSANDERPSSQATGAVAIGILVSVFIFLMIGDVMTVLGYLWSLLKDCR